MRDFKRFNVWRKAHALTLEVYRVTMTFPRHEQFGLTSQLRRSCGSIPANIAEGCGRESDKDFSRFLTLAAGSASETEYHLLLACDLGYLNAEHYDTMAKTVTEIRRMLAGLIRKLRSNGESDGPPFPLE